MLSQEFSLPDVLTLWDALLTDNSRYPLKFWYLTKLIFLNLEQNY